MCQRLHELAFWYLLMSIHHVKSWRFVASDFAEKAPLHSAQNPSERHLRASQEATQSRTGKMEGVDVLFGGSKNHPKTPPGGRQEWWFIWILVVVVPSSPFFGYKQQEAVHYTWQLPASIRRLCLIQAVSRMSFGYPGDFDCWWMCEKGVELLWWQAVDRPDEEVGRSGWKRVEGRLMVATSFWGWPDSGWSLGIA